MVTTYNAAGRAVNRSRVIVCEGTVTKPRYFKDSGTPKTLVERAVELKREADGKARRA
jgi:hypothetical protein